jgi:hypothetical protein
MENPVLEEVINLRVVAEIPGVNAIQCCGAAVMRCCSRK